jgi:hypothetical protein
MSHTVTAVAAIVLIVAVLAVAWCRWMQPGTYEGRHSETVLDMNWPELIHSELAAAGLQPKPVYPVTPPAEPFASPAWAEVAHPRRGHQDLPAPDSCGPPIWAPIRTNPVQQVLEQHRGGETDVLGPAGGFPRPLSPAGPSTLPVAYYTGHSAGQRQLLWQEHDAIDDTAVDLLPVIRDSLGGTSVKAVLDYLFSDLQAQTRWAS